MKLKAIADELSGTNTHRASLRGTVRIPPLACGGEDPTSCHVMAGGVRKDIASDLNRNKGVEVELVDDEAASFHDFVLRGKLAVEGF